MDDIIFLKKTLKSNLNNQITVIIESSYSNQTQNLFNALSLSAYKENKINRYTYLMQWVDWCLNIRNAANTLQTTIDNTNTAEELGSLSLNLLEIAGNPPNITIEEALQIQD